MANTKRVVAGALLVVLALLGAYCSYRAYGVHRALNGRPDVNAEGRNWSVGAMACFVGCAVVAVGVRKKG